MPVSAKSPSVSQTSGSHSCGPGAIFTAFCCKCLRSCRRGVNIEMHHGAGVTPSTWPKAEVRGKRQGHPDGDHTKYNFGCYPPTAKWNQAGQLPQGAVPPTEVGSQVSNPMLLEQHPNLPIQSYPPPSLLIAGASPQVTHTSGIQYNTHPWGHRGDSWPHYSCHSLVWYSNGLPFRGFPASNQ